MIKIDLPPEAEKLLAEMARETGQSIEEIARDAVLERLEDWQDVRIAEERLKDDKGEYISLEDVMRDLDLIDGEGTHKKPAAE